MGMVERVNGHVHVLARERVLPEPVGKPLDKVHFEINAL
jgi:hypothetical protein